MLEKRNGNMVDTDKLFNENQKLVTFVLKPIIHKTPKTFRRQHYEDMKQEALMGLYKACKNFDESKGYTFSTYAAKSIKGEVLSYIEKQCRSRRIIGNLPTISLDALVEGEEGDLSLAEVFGREDPESIVWIFTDKRLDDRQKTICKLLSEGYNQREIGEKLGISGSMVSRHVQKIKEILRKE